MVAMVTNHVIDRRLEISVPPLDLQEGEGLKVESITNDQRFS